LGTGSFPEPLVDSGHDFIVTVLILPIALRPSYLPITVGGVAPQDIQAPSSLSFISTVQTDAARKDAERTVSPKYLPADPAIARKKLDELRTILGFITSVRSDKFANRDQKSRDLLAIKNVKFNIEETSLVLDLLGRSVAFNSIRKRLRVLEESCGYHQGGPDF
jgi:membrane-associated HD superfamily phosphohydrolase